VNSNPTVYVEQIAGQRALRMIWQQTINPADVPLAFESIVHYLDMVDGPVDILVDLTRNPAIPLATTVRHTLMGPQRHRKMGRWLVVGTNRTAEAVADVISHIGPRIAIHWFSTEEEALAALPEAHPEPGI